MNEHHDDDAVESLFRIAGRRSRLPDGEIEPIRAAARNAWRRHVRQTVWRRRAAVGATALAAVLLMAVGLRLGQPAQLEAPAQPLAVLELQTGAVTVTAGHAVAPALAAGSVVTTGADGRAALRLAVGPSLRLDASTLVRLDSADRLILERGAVYVDADPSHPGPAVVVDTALGSIRHVGTQFEVRLLAAEPPSVASALRVRVREGAVQIERRAQSYDIAAGTELRLAADGTASETAIAADGEGWEWTQRAAPALDIDGATLAVFLAWVARETGLEWHYADPSLEPAAREIVLHGSIDGLTPAEALAVVLPGCGLHHRRVETGWLLESADAS